MTALLATISTAVFVVGLSTVLIRKKMAKEEQRQIQATLANAIVVPAAIENDAFIAAFVSMIIEAVVAAAIAFVSMISEAVVAAFVSTISKAFAVLSTRTQVFVVGRFIEPCKEMAEEKQRQMQAALASAIVIPAAIKNVPIEIWLGVTALILLALAITAFASGKAFVVLAFAIVGFVSGLFTEFCKKVTKVEQVQMKAALGSAIVVCAGIMKCAAIGNWLGFAALVLLALAIAAFVVGRLIRLFREKMTNEDLLRSFAAAIVTAIVALLVVLVVPADIKFDKMAYTEVKTMARDIKNWQFAFSRFFDAAADIKNWQLAFFRSIDAVAVTKNWLVAFARDHPAIRAYLLCIAALGGFLLLELIRRVVDERNRAQAERRRQRQLRRALAGRTSDF